MIIRGLGGAGGRWPGRPEPGVGPGSVLGHGITVSCESKWLKEGSSWKWWVGIGKQVSRRGAEVSRTVTAGLWLLLAPVASVKQAGGLAMSAEDPVLSCCPPRLGESAFYLIN